MHIISCYRTFPLSCNCKGCTACLTFFPFRWWHLDISQTSSLYPELFVNDFFNKFHGRVISQAFRAPVCYDADSQSCSNLENPRWNSAWSVASVVAGSRAAAIDFVDPCIRAVCFVCNCKPLFLLPVWQGSTRDAWTLAFALIRRPEENGYQLPWHV